MSKHHNSLTSLLFTLFLMACGGSSTTTPPPGPTDKTAPTLVSSLPIANASAVPVNVKLGFVFSEPMEKSSLELSGTPSVILVNPTWNAGSTSVAFDNANLLPATAYTLTLNAKDTSGNALATTSIAFTTSKEADTTPPRLQSSIPADGATDIDPRIVSLKLFFSEPMDTSSFSLTLTPPNAFPELRTASSAGTAPLNVTWSEADTVATLRLEQELLKESTLFIVTLTRAKDKAGNELSGNNDIAFTTDKDAPQLISSIPTNGAKNVPLAKHEIRLMFSKAMDTPTFKATLALEPDVPFDFAKDLGFTWGNGDKEVIIKPEFPAFASFLDQTVYTLTLSGKSKEGKALANLKVIFETVADESAPNVTEVSPKDGAVVIRSPVFILIGFDDLMDEASMLGAVSSSPELPCTWKANFAGNDSVFRSLLLCESSTGALQEATTYTITVSTTAKDTSGKPLSSPFSFGFNTFIPPTGPGKLQINISGAPNDQAKVRATGPNAFDSGVLSSSQTFTSLSPGTYNVAAEAFSTGQPGKPSCRIYIPTPESQTVTVSAGATSTVTVSYDSIPC
jgi:Bacterial Ig-like domain